MASERVYQLIHERVSGGYTVADDDLFKVLARLKQLDGIQIEPSASAAFLGLKLFDGRKYLGSTLSTSNSRATPIFWTTRLLRTPGSAREILSTGLRTT